MAQQVGTVGQALWIVGLVLGLFYYWFAVANRYVIFLYTHLGATPFDAITRSRYWMSGLVAAGFVLVIYTGRNLLAGWAARRRRWDYQAPVWWRLWLVCAIPVAAGILWITMRLNWPTLPLGLALACVASTWAGLALALLPGSLAASHPGRVWQLMVYGAGLVPSLLLVRAVELPGQGILTPGVAYAVVGGALLGGWGWLVLLLRLQADVPAPHAIYAAGLVWSYLLLPLLHYLFFTPPDYHYITASANFFAQGPWVQLASWLAAAGVLLGALAWDRRRRLRAN